MNDEDFKRQVDALARRAAVFEAAKALGLVRCKRVYIGAAHEIECVTCGRKWDVGDRYECPEGIYEI